MESPNMYVIKRNNTKQEVKFDKITTRIKNLTQGLSPLIDSTIIAQKVIAGVKPGIHTYELDVLASEIAHSFTTTHPDYSRLAARLLISNLHKETPKKFSECIEKLYNNHDSNYNDHCPLVSKEVYELTKKYKDKLDSWIVDQRDLDNYDYFGYKTLEISYLTRINDQIIERPQYLYMRVALGIHLEDLKSVKETYNLMSQKYFTHATPTLFNFGTTQQQGSSCFLVYTGDSIPGIYGKALTQSALLSKHAGGLGIHFSDVRASGSRIKGTQGKSNGIIPFLKVFNETAQAVNQSGRRPGSFAIYLEPWHADILKFLEIRLSNGNEKERARELFTAVWLNDLFMERVQNNKQWTLFCPNECPGLTTSYGNDFKKLYLSYEAQPSKIRKQLPAQTVFKYIITSLRETGTPYLLNKDSANIRNNQKNLGTLKGSNLCAEILIYTDPNEIGTCNLASICLPSFVEYTPSTNKPRFNFTKLEEVTRVITRNLNKIIDTNFYPVPEARNANLKHRPIAIGVQGLWDTFMKFRYPFTSLEAKRLNTKIFEHIYFAFLTESNNLAKSLKKTYQSYPGSPASQNILQFDMWNTSATEWNNLHKDKKKFNQNWKRPLATLSIPSKKWDALRKSIATHGLLNSLGIALMPTASTSNIMGFNECFECRPSNMFVRHTKSGEFYIVNKYLIEDLIKLKLWNKEIREQIIINDGSIQSIPSIPNDIKELYKTIWEQDPEKIIDLSVARAPFIDHTESLNTYILNPSEKNIIRNFTIKWRKGLKTINYYLRQKVNNPIKFSIDASKLITPTPTPEDTSSPKMCKIDDPDCEACGS